MDTCCKLVRYLTTYVCMYECMVVWLYVCICMYALISTLLIGGIELIPTSAYGVRLYRNGSSMVMHNDKVSCDYNDDDGRNDYDDNDDIGYGYDDGDEDVDLTNTFLYFLIDL